MNSHFPNLTGVILAGGQARRMGGEDKGLIQVNGKAMIDYVITILESQLSKIVINANRNLDVYRRYGYPVVPDDDTGFKGPLSGMASCMKKIETEYMITAPCDSPNLPPDYVSRMWTALDEHNAEICVADSGERIQPVFTLLKCSLLGSLLAYMESGERKIDLWFAQHNMVTADFSDRPQTFINVNTPEDIRVMESGIRHESA